MSGDQGVQLVAALLTGVAVTALVSVLVPPTRRLAPRVRPYTVASRTSLGRSADVLSVAAPSAVVGGGTLRRMVRPGLQALADRLGRLVDSSGEEAMLLKLRQAGMMLHLPEGERLRVYRIKQLGTTALFTVGGVLAAVVLGAAPGLVVLSGLLGFVFGTTRGRGRLERAIDRRREQMRIEVYTVNQLLAIRVRVGGGVVQAVQQLVSRGTGAVVEELGEALRLYRNGMPASEAFARLAKLTAEPHCARTYAVLGTAEERGADLAEALLALSEDVRAARREALRRSATRRRAAMLIPTIAIIAPTMLLFVGAPLPRLIFGWQ